MDSDDSNERLKALVDDGAIADDEVLVRVIRPSWVDFGFDPPRPGNAAFQDQKLEVAQEVHGLAARCASISVKSIWLLSCDGDIAGLLSDFDEGAGLVQFSAGQIRRLATKGPAGTTTGVPRPQGVMLHPLTSAPWHAVMWDLSGTRSKGAQSALAGIATWLHLPAPAL